MALLAHQELQEMWQIIWVKWQWPWGSWELSKALSARYVSILLICLVIFRLSYMAPMYEFVDAKSLINDIVTWILLVVGLLPSDNLLYVHKRFGLNHIDVAWSFLRLVIRNG